MHELAICERVVSAVLAEMENHGIAAGDLRSARVAAGALQQIVPDSLTMAYEILTRNTPAQGSVLVVRVIPVRVRCEACGAEGDLEQHIFVCPSCSSTEVAVLTGRELYLEALETHDD